MQVAIDYAIGSNWSAPSSTMKRKLRSFPPLAQEVTASLRLLDAEDPVRYDFALCHYGMSGMCPAQPVPEHCAKCELLTSCGVGPRVVARAQRASR